MELKIKIKETKQDRRELTREEWFARKIPLKEQKVRAFLDEIGYVYTTHRYDGGEYGSALFRKEITRDATPEEIDAWLYLYRDKTVCLVGPDSHCNDHCLNTKHCNSYKSSNEKATEILKCKEIILELVE